MIKIKKKLKIVGIVLALIIAFVGIVLYAPIVIPIALLIVCCSNENKQNKKQGSSPPMETEEFYEIIDD